MLDKRTLRLAVLLLVFAPGPAAAHGSASCFS
jgi:hypothetical protein